MRHLGFTNNVDGRFVRSERSYWMTLFLGDLRTHRLYCLRIKRPAGKSAFTKFSRRMPSDDRGETVSWRMSHLRRLYRRGFLLANPRNLGWFNSPLNNTSLREAGT